MKVAADKQQGVVVLKPEGRLDAVNGPDLDAAIGSALDAGERRIVIDLEGVPYISSAGLGVLLKGAKRARAEDGRIALSSLHDQVTDVFQVSGFLTLFVVHETCAEAVAELEGGAC